MGCGVEFMEGCWTENLRSKENLLFEEEGRGVDLISCVQATDDPTAAELEPQDYQLRVFDRFRVILVSVSVILN